MATRQSPRVCPSKGIRHIAGVHGRPLVSKPSQAASIQSKSTNRGPSAASNQSSVNSIQQEGVPLTPVDANLSLVEVPQAAGMKEVQVRQDDVPRGPTCDAQAGALAHVPRAHAALWADTRGEQADDPVGVLLAVQVHARIDQDESSIGVHRKAGATDCQHGNRGDIEAQSRTRMGRRIPAGPQLADRRRLDNGHGPLSTWRAG